MRTSSSEPVKKSTAALVAPMNVADGVAETCPTDWPALAVPSM